jgi:DNA repair protein RadC
LIDTSDRAVEYWKANIQAAPWFDPSKEAFVVLVLNTRRRILGHNLVTLGTLDTCTVHPREVFRPVIVAAGAAVILMHNHPSGDPTPSESDIKVTRDLIRAGQLLKIEVLDHVIVGAGDKRTSLRELGFFYS